MANFHHICRLCLERNECLLPLFEDECNLPSKLNNLIPALKVHFGDGLPAQICTQCAQQINTSFTFKLRCESSDASLRQQLNVEENHLTVAKREEFENGAESPGHDESYSEAEHWLPDVKIEIKEFKAERNDDYAASASLSEDSQEQEIFSPQSKKTIADKDNAKAFSCNECGKTFRKRHNLVHHARTHRRKAPHTCVQCGKGFYRRNTYNKHMQSHKIVRNKPYTCLECGKSFHHSHILKEHERVHTGERPFSCTLCGKSFGQGGNLTNHMRSHTGVRPFLCTVCGRRFGFNSTLSKHMMTHSGDRPYLCPVCGKSFSLTCTLKKHMLTHTDEKPFSCQECGRRFNRKDHLKCHLRTHLPSSEAPLVENWTLDSSISETVPLSALNQSGNTQQNNADSETYSECLAGPGTDPWLTGDRRDDDKADASETCRKPLLIPHTANADGWLPHDEVREETVMTNAHESNILHSALCHCP